MGASGARVAATGAPTGTLKPSQGAVVQKPATATKPVAAPAQVKPKAVPATEASAFTREEATLCLDIVEGEVSRAIIANAVPATMLDIAKTVVKKLRAQSGIPESIPLPWDLAPPQISSSPVPDPVPVPDLQAPTATVTEVAVNGATSPK
jgi:hypothetical protein